MALCYRSANLPPEINKLDVPDVSAADGARAQTRLNVRWDVSDPNDDDLNLHRSGPQGRLAQWVPLTENADYRKDLCLGHDGRAGGLYRLRLIASDRPSNNPDDALDPRAREPSSSSITNRPGHRDASRKDRRLIALKDNLTRLVKADYALDGGDWTPLFPDDGLFDTPANRSRCLAGPQARHSPPHGPCHRRRGQRRLR